MTRPLIFLAALCLCAGCAQAPSPHSARPSQQRKTPTKSSAKPDKAIEPSHGGRVRHSYAAAEPRVTGSADSSLQREVDGWFAGLSQGKIQYKIPNTMFWKEGTTITVVVQGPQAPAGSGLVEPSGESEITVSNRMRVVPSCPDNPDEFTFTPESGTTEIQFVPTNGSTRWTWSVTPKYTGASQRLQISASVLYPGQDDKVQLQLPVYTTTVNVNVPGFGDTLKRLIEGDPQYWLQYGLPGGGGFAFVVAIVTWFFTRKARRKKRSKKASPQPTGR